MLVVLVDHGGNGLGYEVEGPISTSNIAKIPPLWVAGNYISRLGGGWEWSPLAILQVSFTLCDFALWWSMGVMIGG
jgi:hypothetical protein